jgi:hypothetical protein
LIVGLGLRGLGLRWLRTFGALDGGFGFGPDPLELGRELGPGLLVFRRFEILERGFEAIAESARRIVVGIALQMFFKLFPEAVDVHAQSPFADGLRATTSPNHSISAVMA